MEKQSECCPSPRELSELKEFFEKTLEPGHVPGLAIAVINEKLTLPNARPFKIERR